MNLKRQSGKLPRYSSAFLAYTDMSHDLVCLPVYTPVPDCIVLALLNGFEALVCRPDIATQVAAAARVQLYFTAAVSYSGRGCVSE